MSKLSINNADLQEILEAVNALPEAGSGGGVDLPELVNPGSASDLLEGKELIDGAGNIVTGIIPTKTNFDISVSGPTMTVPSGYYAFNVTKIMDPIEQATPSINVSTSGLITASATQTAGYVTAGTKSATLQLLTEEGKTVIPTKSSQNAASRMTFVTGNITVAPIPDEYQDITEVTATAEDVMSGKKIVNSSGIVTGAFTLDSELSAQDDLITQIQSAVDSFPQGGGGNASYDTCILQINNQSGQPYALGYTSVENGKIVAKYSYTSASTSIICLCGSTFCCYKYGTLVSSSITRLGNIDAGDCYSEAYRIDASANETIIVNIYDTGHGSGGID